MILSKLIYILVVLFLLLFTVLYVDSTAVVMLCVCLAVPFFMAAVLLTGSRRLSLSLYLPDGSVTRGESALCRVEIKKSNRLPVFCKIVLTAENSMTGEKRTGTFKGLVYGKSKDFAVKVRAEHSGSIKIGVKKLVAYDYFKLFHRNIKGGAYESISVFPRLCEIDGRLVTMPTVDEEGDIYSKTQSGNDPSEIFDIREFRQEDDPRKIHWKLSAKTEDFFVKEYGQPMLNSIVLFLDNSHTAPDLQDGLLDLLLSLSDFLLEQSTAHIICLSGADGTLSRCWVSTGEELYGAVNGILGRPFSAAEKHAAVNEFLSASDAKHTHLIYLTADFSAEESSLFREQPLPVTVMAASKGNGKNIYDDNFRCIFVDFRDISNSLSGLEL